MNIFIVTVVKIKWGGLLPLKKTGWASYYPEFRLAVSATKSLQTKLPLEM